ncbi:replication-relaxation family protein [Actinomyces oris]|uniref:Replication-relaxation family protein n=1 Tax=Actinomyces oris TaxID=544580 RepID=A0AAW8LDN1_9ACTO|nr:replication-relaxation family protein [Actinomyces oris]MDR0178029.1 replication-relaxation family protein [Actinomyces oris]
MNRSPTTAAARFSSLVPPPIHPMQARLLALVAAHRFATTTQLARLTALEYASPASALRQTQRHLASLAQQRLLTSLERRVGGWQGGSAVTIWAATTRGHRRVAAENEEDEGEVPRRQRPREVSTTFLDHLLAITEVRTSIEEAVRQEADTEAAVALEPDCWRTALSPSGQVQVLRPDLAVTITSPAYEDRYLIEVDRATENPGRVIATCWRYQEHQAQVGDGGVFPLVVWLVPNDRRRHRLERAIAHSTGLLRDLFRVIRLDQLPTLIHGGPAAIPTPQASNQVG